MILTLKLLLIISLLSIAYQDLKERKVSLLLFIGCALLLGYLHFLNVESIHFLNSVLMNNIIIILLLFILGIYSKIKLKRSLKDTFGLGDAVFFLSIAIAFPTYTFLVLFSFSLVFSGLLFFLFKKKFNHPTVPLAGLQATFLAIIFSLNWTFQFVDLYFI